MNQKNIGTKQSEGMMGGKKRKELKLGLCFMCMWEVGRAPWPVGRVPRQNHSHGIILELAGAMVFLRSRGWGSTSLARVKQT